MSERRPGVSPQRGAVLIVSIVMIVIVVGFSGAMLVLAQSEQRVARYELERVAAMTRAEGATSLGVRASVEAVRGYGTAPTSGTVTVGGRTVSYTVMPVGTQYTTVDPTGVQVLHQQYHVAATSTEGGARVVCHRLFDIGRVPLFQFAAFYDGDLEINPGSTTTISGRVHTNSSLYVAPESGTLNFDTEYVRAAGSVFRRRKETGGAASGATVRANVLGPSGLANWATTLESPLWNFKTAVLAAFNGTIQSGTHGVPKVAIHGVEAISPGAFYDVSAGVRIIDGQVYQNGTNITSTLPAGTVMDKVVYDAREGRNVTLTTIDLAKLGPYFPANGLIYASRSDATPSQPNGIRLENGSTLAGPLTVVSPNPVYIKGNFNTVAKKPASVISDSLNLLSNAWNDTKTASTLPVATATTYNVSFATGNVVTAGSAYSGGYENLTRLHENWSGVTMTVVGSMNCLWPSTIAVAAWRFPSGNYYRTPTRAFGIDPALLSGTLPPFTPMSVQVTQTIYWVDK